MKLAERILALSEEEISKVMVVKVGGVEYPYFTRFSLASKSGRTAMMKFIDSRGGQVTKHLLGTISDGTLKKFAKKWSSLKPDPEWLKKVGKLPAGDKSIQEEAVNENSKNNGKEIADLGKKLLKEDDKEKILEGLDLLLVHMSFVLRDLDMEDKMNELRRFREKFDIV